MKYIYCKNIEEFNKIKDILLKKGYVLDIDFYSDFPDFSYHNIIIYEPVKDVIDWTYTTIFDIIDMVYAKDVINELRKEKLNKII